jgi:AmiR/NasT family two-component response regulator
MLVQDNTKGKVLVVEDESIIARDIISNLQEMGYTVVGHAVSGAQAVEIAKLESPDIVLMDIVLQGDMDGIKTARIIKEGLNIPVIYLTAYTDDAIVKRAKLTEPFGYIIKPFDESSLSLTLEMGLYKHKMELEREKYTAELKAALAKVETLQGMLPICAWCKKIRDDKGYWKQVEIYVEEHTHAEFTHSMCPDCKTRMEEELTDYK